MQRGRGSILFVILIGFLIGIGVNRVISTQYPKVWAAIVVVTALAIVPFIYEFHRGAIDPFAPILWVSPLFIALYTGPAAERLLLSDFTFKAQYMIPGHATNYMFEVLIFSAIGLVFLIIGYYWEGGKRASKYIPTFQSTWSSRRAWASIVVLILVGVTGYLSLSFGNGPRTQLAKGSNMYAFIAVNLLNTASILIITEILLNHTTYRDLVLGFGSPIKIGGMSLLVLINLQLLWTLGGRKRAFIIFVIGLFLLHYLYRKFSVLGGIGAYVFVTFLPEWAAELVISLLGLDFDVFIRTLTNPVFLVQSPTRAFNNIVILFSGVPNVLDYQYGMTFLSAFFAVVPWQPVPQTQRVYNNAFYPEIIGDYGVPITLIGELYVNFWIIGVVGGMLLLGVAMRTFYEWAVVSHSTTASLVLFSTVANTFLIGGNFSNSAPNLGLKVLPLLLTLIFICGIDYSPTRNHIESHILSR